MDLATVTAEVTTVTSLLTNLDKIKEFAEDAISLAETMAATGAQKLAAVLAATQAFVASLTTLADVAAQAWAAIKSEITAFVNGVVALWNSLSWGSSATPAASA